MKLITWNINGIRAAEKKGFLDYLVNSGADIMCVQETKAQIEQIPALLLAPAGYRTWWNSAGRKGYSGTGVLSRIEPLSVEYGFGTPDFDHEGRTLILDFGDYLLYNI